MNIQKLKYKFHSGKNSKPCGITSRNTPVFILLPAS